MDNQTALCDCPICISNLRDKVKRLNEAYTRIREREADLNKQLKAADVANGQLYKEIAAEKVRVNALVEGLERANESNAKLLDLRRDYTNAADQKEEMLNAMAAENGTLDKRNKDLAAQVNRRDRRINELEQAIADMKGRWYYPSLPAAPWVVDPTPTYDNKDLRKKYDQNLYELELRQGSIDRLSKRLRDKEDQVEMLKKAFNGVEKILSVYHEITKTKATPPPTPTGKVGGSYDTGKAASLTNFI